MKYDNTVITTSSSFCEIRISTISRYKTPYIQADLYRVKTKDSLVMTQGLMNQT